MMLVSQHLYFFVLGPVPYASLFGKGAIKQTWTTKPAQIDS